MIFLSPVSRLRLERQMHGDEDCLRIENPSSAVSTQMRRALVLFLAEGLSGIGVAFFLDTFTWRNKKKYLAKRRKNTIQIAPFHPLPNPLP